MSFGVFELSKNLRSLSLKNNININRIAQCLYSAKAPAQKIVKEIDPNTGELKSRKTTIIPKITLLSGDLISITTLTEAETLSKRRGLKLVKILDLDTKSKRPVYKLMTGAEYHAEDLKQREERKKQRENVFIKGEKVVLISSKITQHDLETHLRKAIKWIEKMFEVRVVISGNIDASEKIYSLFEDHFKQQSIAARIVQKRLYGSEIKFQIIPQKKNLSTTSGSSNNQENNNSKKGAF